ncbi:rCG43284 [Rattus norvegicus]|uniref:RCG43284 n=1 Tax=Rattus norvegicus TaxID=10116 RepID=A6IWL8_RAT|nr:rCG43284 [Rattus norvegicus]
MAGAVGLGPWACGSHLLPGGGQKTQDPQVATG